MTLHPGSPVPLTGAVQVSGGRRSVPLRAGESAFVPDGTTVTLTSHGQVYRAAPGDGTPGEPS